MTQDELVKQSKEEILDLLQGINRLGIDNTIKYLQESTYFSARCHSHHQFLGGLAVHSLGVYKEFEQLNTGLPEDSIRIVSLFHDKCKAHHVDSYIYATCKKGKEVLIDDLHNNHSEFYSAFYKIIP